MKRLSIAVAALAVAAGLAVPVAASAAPKQDLVQTAVAAGQFKTLVSLVKQAGLAGTLSGKTKYTVFAPTDAAFAKVPKKTLAALGKNKAALKQVLLYHVVAARCRPRRSSRSARQDRRGLQGPHQGAQRHRLPEREDQGRQDERARLQRDHPRHQQGPDPEGSRPVAASPLSRPRRRSRRRRRPWHAEECVARSWDHVGPWYQSRLSGAGAGRTAPAAARRAPARPAARGGAEREHRGVELPAAPGRRVVDGQAERAGERVERQSAAAPGAEP